MAALALLSSALTFPSILGIAIASCLFYFFLRSRPKMGKNLPEKMKRLVVLETPDNFEGFNDFKDFKVRVELVPLPSPGPGEVLVKMVAAAVNPSDEGDLSEAAKGKGGPLPRVFGREGSGVVVASGGGFMAGGMLGKKVGVCDLKAGTWQEYICMPAKPPGMVKLVFRKPNHGLDVQKCRSGTCVLDQSLPVETAASFFVNPLTGRGRQQSKTRHQRKSIFPQLSASLMWPRGKDRLPSSTRLAMICSNCSLISSGPLCMWARASKINYLYSLCCILY